MGAPVILVEVTFIEFSGDERGRGASLWVFLSFPLFQQWSLFIDNVQNLDFLHAPLRFSYLALRAWRAKFVS